MVYTIALDIQYGFDNVISLQLTTRCTKFVQEVSYNIKYIAFPATRNLQTNIPASIQLQFPEKTTYRYGN